jgi:hypothetical protein
MVRKARLTVRVLRPTWRFLSQRQLVEYPSAIIRVEQANGIDGGGADYFFDPKVCCSSQDVVARLYVDVVCRPVVGRSGILFDLDGSDGFTCGQRRSIVWVVKGMNTSKESAARSVVQI